jgi:ATP-dependent RNA helicase DDX41
MPHPRQQARLARLVAASRSGKRDSLSPNKSVDNTKEEEKGAGGEKGPTLVQQVAQHKRQLVSEGRAEELTREHTAVEKQIISGLGRLAPLVSVQDAARTAKNKTQKSGKRRRSRSDRGHRDRSRSGSRERELYSLSSGSDDEEKRTRRGDSASRSRQSRRKRRYSSGGSSSSGSGSSGGESDDGGPGWRATNATSWQPPGYLDPLELNPADVQARRDFVAEAERVRKHLALDVLWEGKMGNFAPKANAKAEEGPSDGGAAAVAVVDTRDRYERMPFGDIPSPPIVSFEEMRLPHAIRAYLAGEGILEPTPVQAQCLPVALTGRDCIGVATTGSGKTMVFTLPAVMRAMEEELKEPLRRGDGPICIIMSPSRELAKQTFEIARQLCDSLTRGTVDSGEANNRNNQRDRKPLLEFQQVDESPPLPELNVALCTGGISLSEQREQLLRPNGVHIVVATPGRLVDLLNKQIVELSRTKLLAMDEADRLVDPEGHEEEVRAILNFFAGPRQMLLFSATMPKGIQAFARSALVSPVEVNASGRAGAAALTVFQEIYYVDKDRKMDALLEALQKTPPPVVCFCENKQDVDDIHEFLLRKGVDVASVHGGREQVDRHAAIDAFRGGRKTVLVATDVASKGLDFQGIQHVINYDLPKEIESYVHRIGRTGRRGNAGVATTFICKRDLQDNPAVLLDLRGVIQECKQRMPPVLEHAEELMGIKVDTSRAGEECPVCSGLGHRIEDCPKVQNATRGGASGDVRGEEA